MKKKYHIFDFYKISYDYSLLCQRTLKFNTYVHKAKIFQYVIKKYWSIYFFKKKFINYKNVFLKYIINSK